jgi:DNA topoisomerase-3
VQGNLESESLPDHLFIAEKPSLAEAIAKARAEQKGVSASKSDGYWRVGDDAVTWLFGHMYELAYPHEYDERYKTWKLEHLPIIPAKWRRNPHKDKAKHLSVIKGLLKESKKVVNAGDAEREGQLLVDELLEEMGWDPFSDRTKRIWVSSMARKDMLVALDGMFPNRDKQNLFFSAYARQKADWAHGLNMTRLYTNLARQTGADMLVTVGRVQTPTLWLVVERDRLIEAFKPVDHYLPTGIFRHANGSFKADWRAGSSPTPPPTSRRPRRFPTRSRPCRPTARRSSGSPLSRRSRWRSPCTRSTRPPPTRVPTAATCPRPSSRTRRRAS